MGTDEEFGFAYVAAGSLTARLRDGPVERRPVQQPEQNAFHVFQQSRILRSCRNERRCREKEPDHFKPRLHFLAVGGKCRTVRIGTRREKMRIDPDSQADAVARESRFYVP